MVRLVGSKKITPVPGQVLICLAGKYRGRRVVCLKDLGKGVFLITGPFKVNGVPLRRVNRRYVICTTTHIDISSIVGDLTVDKTVFARPKRTGPTPVVRHTRKAKGVKSDDEKKPKKKAIKVGEARKALQEKVDGQLIAILKAADPLLPKYLGSFFTLKMNDRPHLMKF
eukprot:NODE_3150_length_591_cov_589.782288_g2636_i0.p1 GENE.NODE_3150_length_591_cov_589.782288_g2636_i0~~NODE_3150_length_591_cov_589.782288_g2636_i0.p1  ORF type:complete len:188 (-),score=66.61 NODE_3150_length_591_cov_589.782288_g2636_i0:27-533(-)